MNKLIPFSMLSIVIAACVYPTQRLVVPDDRPSLSVKNAPADAVLFVDNMDMGSAAQYDGKKKVLPVERGKHRVVVKCGNTTVYSQEMYAGGGETRTIQLSGGTSK